MVRVAGYTCGRCGEWHDELPFAYAAEAPAYWTEDLQSDPQSELGEEQCVIGGEHFFVRGRVCLPVEGSEEPFEWGVWVSLSEENFARVSEQWDEEGREDDPPMFGWLSSELPVYAASTLSLRTTVHTQPVGVRPLVELEPAEHPLAIEQREGISLARVQQFAEALLHDDA
jgi:hypothetical protein